MAAWLRDARLEVCRHSVLRWSYNCGHSTSSSPSSIMKSSLPGSPLMKTTWRSKACHARLDGKPPTITRLPQLTNRTLPSARLALPDMNVPHTHKRADTRKTTHTTARANRHSNSKHSHANASLLEKSVQAAPRQAGTGMWPCCRIGAHSILSARVRAHLARLILAGLQDVDDRVFEFCCGAAAEHPSVRYCVG